LSSDTERLANLGPALPCLPSLPDEVPLELVDGASEPGRLAEPAQRSRLPVTDQAQVPAVPRYPQLLTSMHDRSFVKEP
jgi:hypothetical protein